MENVSTTRSDFATRLYTKVADAHADKNLVLSPFCVQVALAIAAVGARGDTRQELVDLIGAPENVDQQNEEYARLLRTFHHDDERPYHMVAANGLWGQHGFHFNPLFQEAIAEYYDAALHIVDFRAEPAAAVRSINTWVSDKTRARIIELLNRNMIVADTRLVLTSAIHFRAQWEEEFEKAATKPARWFGPNQHQVMMMHQENGFLYYEGDDYQAVNLPYMGRRFNMLIVLPKKRDGLAELEKRWASQQTFRKVTKGLDPEMVIVSLPRFKFEAEFQLKSALCALHADLAFSDNADFSGIADEPLKISEVIHKAFIEVNEEGTEAAAATAVLMALCAGVGSRPAAPVVFNADHPFLFFIWDRKAETVFFTGRVVDPS